MKHFPWEWLVGFAAGLGFGILYSWVISPVRYVDTSPDTLLSEFKEAYRSLVAASYASDHNLPRARSRLAILGDLDPQNLWGTPLRAMALLMCPPPRIEEFRGPSYHG